MEEEVVVEMEEKWVEAGRQAAYTPRTRPQLMCHHAIVSPSTEHPRVGSMLRSSSPSYAT